MTEEKKFAILPKEFITNICDEIGITIDESIVLALAEDATYRIREILDLSNYFVRHSNRTRMKTEDLNKTFFQYNIEKPWGASADSIKETEYKFIEGANVYVKNDETINLVEYSFDDEFSINMDETALDEVTVKPGHQSDFVCKISTVPMPSNDMIQYFQIATAITLGDNVDLFAEVLLDVKSNSKIFPIVPYFVNFFSGINVLSHDLEKMNRLLQLIKALMSNKYLNCDEYIHAILTAVSYCVLEPLTASMYSSNDHWRLRDSGANLIGLILNTCTFVDNHICTIETSISNIINDPTRPLCSHYGALRILLSLSEKSISKLLLPNLQAYYKNSLAILSETTTLNNICIKEDAHKTLGSINNCVGLVLRTDTNDMLMADQVYQLYPEIYELLGEAVISQISFTCHNRQKGSFRATREPAFKHVLFNSSSDNSPKSTSIFKFPTLKNQQDIKRSLIKRTIKVTEIFDINRKVKPIIIGFGKAKPLKCKPFQSERHQSISFQYNEILKKCNFIGKAKTHFSTPSNKYCNFLSWCL